MIFEVCCGSVNDCVTAYKNGADRIELNSAMFLGGLTPSLGSFIEAKRLVNIPIICMVRNRADGFCYDVVEFNTMLRDAKIFLENGADGIVFGFLNNDFSVNKNYTLEMVNLIHSFDKEAVFHMAIDCVNDIDDAIKTLIDCGVDRVLSRGQNISAILGNDILKYLEKTYGSNIEIIGGCGINAGNVKNLINYTGLKQVHASCKSYMKDVTGRNGIVDYTYSENGYEVVDSESVKKMREEIDNV